MARTIAITIADVSKCAEYTICCVFGYILYAVAVVYCISVIFVYVLMTMYTLSHVTF